MWHMQCLTSASNFRGSAAPLDPVFLRPWWKSEVMLLFLLAGCHVTVGSAPCHLRPSDKKRLAANNAAKQAAFEQRASNERVKLLQVSWHSVWDTIYMSYVLLLGSLHNISEAIDSIKYSEIFIVYNMSGKVEHTKLLLTLLIMFSNLCVLLACFTVLNLIFDNTDMQNVMWMS